MASMKSGEFLRPLCYLFETGTLAGSSDAQLLERFVAGRDERAFGSSGHPARAIGPRGLP